MEVLVPRATCVPAGYALDSLLPGRTITAAYDKKQKKLSYELLFADVNRNGVAPVALKALLRPGVFSGVVDEVMAGMQEEYERSASLDYQRLAHFDIRHNGRFHVGGAYWQASFGCWPGSPIFDRSLIEASAAMPAASIWNRRIQHDVLMRYFPRLAGVPLDNNTNLPLILLPGRKQLLARNLYRRVKLLRYFVDRLTSRHGERCRYRRRFDLSCPHWMAVRREVEPYRDCLAEYFDMDRFNRILPSPEAPLTVEVRFPGSGAPKLLVGLLLWARRCLLNAGVGGISCGTANFLRGYSNLSCFGNIRAFWDFI
jgi:hypothetical protein